MSQEKIDEILEKVNRIEGALFPEPTQPSRIFTLEGRVDSLETWRTYLAGAWAAAASIIAYLFAWRHGR